MPDPEVVAIFREQAAADRAEATDGREPAHLIASGNVVTAICRTCRWVDHDPGSWIGASHSAMDHVNANPGHVAMAMEQNSAVYADRGERIT